MHLTTLGVCREKISEEDAMNFNTRRIVCSMIYLKARTYGKNIIFYNTF
jgi:hypothetical protein